MAKKSTNQLSTKSERIVVDEIFDDGRARLLRARRIKNSNLDAFDIDGWQDEIEDFMDIWRVEAFVGFSSGRFLREGDVFFIKDGSKLNDDYGKPKPLLRVVARENHLLCSTEESRTIARNEIKKEFYKLTAEKLPISDKEKERLFDSIEENIAAMNVRDDSEGGA